MRVPCLRERGLYVDNEDSKWIRIQTEDETVLSNAYILGDDVAHLRLAFSASDNPASALYYDGANILLFEDMVEEDGKYLIDQKMPDADSEIFFGYASLHTGGEDGKRAIEAFLLRREEDIESLMDEFRSWDYEQLSWEYAEEDAEEEETKTQAYVLHLMDQNFDLVPGVTVHFKTDSSSEELVSDESGIISFAGVPDVYQVELVSVAEGYSFDSDFSLTTGDTYGQWLLRICRDED